MNIFESKFKEYITEQALTDPLDVSGTYTAEDGSKHPFKFTLDEMRDTQLEIDTTFDAESIFDKYDNIENGDVIGADKKTSVANYRKKSKYKDVLNALIPAISEKTGMSEEYIDSVHIKNLVSDIKKSATTTPDGQLAWKIFLNNYDKLENTDDIGLMRVEYLLKNATTSNDSGVYMFEIDGDVKYIGVANKGRTGKYGFNAVGKEYNRDKTSTAATNMFGNQGGDTRDKINKKLADYVTSKGKDNVVIDWYNIPITPEKAEVLLKDLPSEDIDFTKDSKKSGTGGSISYLEFIESALIKKFDTLSKDIGMQAKGEISNRFQID